jgi:hypothetical protein
LRSNAIFAKLPAIFRETSQQENTNMKTTKLLALSSALLWSATAFAQAPSSSSSETAATTTTTTTTSTVPAIVPTEGSGIVSDAETTTVETTDTTLPATGGAPLLMALSGMLAVGGALIGLKKVR